MDVSTHSAVDSLIEHPRSDLSLGNLSYSTLSMRVKAGRKRKATALHNSNFRAGFVPVTEEALHKTGIRGRKRYFLYCTLGIMLIVAIFNILVTAWLVYILGLSHMGLLSIELSDTGVGPFLRILYEAQIISVTMNRAPLGARHSSNIYFTSQESGLYLESTQQGSNKSSMLFLNGPNVTMTTDNFHIIMDKYGNRLTADLESVAQKIGVSNFNVEALVLPKIVSRTGVDDLYLESASREVSFNASRGMVMQSQHDVEFHARSISLQSRKNIILSSKDGIYLNPHLAKVMPKAKTKPPPPDLQVHKICMCGNGKMFLVPPSISQTSCKIGKKAAKALCGK